MTDLKLTDEILEAVSSGFEKQLNFTKKLVRFPSLRGFEIEAQNFVYKALKERGYEMDRWAIDIKDIEGHPGFSPVNIDYSNAVNVVGTHTPNIDSGKSLILNAHIDVVPEGPLSMWKGSPYNPTSGIL